MKRSVTVRLPDELVASAKADAGRKGISLTWLVQVALEDALGRVDPDVEDQVRDLDRRLSRLEEMAIQ